MTLIIASVTPSAATVVVDSFTTDDNGPGTGGKLYVLGNQLAVMAGRGDAWLIETICSAVNACCLSFDSLVPAVLPHTIAHAAAQISDDRKRMPGGRGFHLTCAGWSIVRNAPAVFVFEEALWGSGAKIRMLAPGDVMCSPAIETGAPLSPADFANPTRVMAIAREQAAYFVRRDGTKGAGGVLVEARVTRDSVSVRHLGDLDAVEREAASMEAAT